MAIRPDIVHIVGHTEADHAATADEIIEASLMARRAIENALQGQPDMTKDEAVLKRKKQLISEASLTLEAIRSLSVDNTPEPFIDPEILANSVLTGILDAPQLKNNPFGQGKVQTLIIDGACEAIDEKGFLLSETRRLEQILSEKKAGFI